MLIAFLTASAVALKRMAGLEESGLAGPSVDSAESRRLVKSCTVIHELPWLTEGKTCTDSSPRRAAAGRWWGWGVGRGRPSRFTKQHLPDLKHGSGPVLTQISLCFIPFRLRGNTFCPEEIEKLSHQDTRLLL